MCHTEGSGREQADGVSRSGTMCHAGGSGREQADGGQPERDNGPRGGFRGVVPPGQHCGLRRNCP
jgi:hypothetical protein